jgi:hypothetical protein
MLACLVFLPGAACVAEDVSAAERASIREIEKSGGEVDTDPYWQVTFIGATDASLAPLRNLTRLEILSVLDASPLTEKGLEERKGQFTEARAPRLVVA